jgi:hypothetical protein
MPFTAEDKIIIADRVMRENWGAKRILHAYPDKPWTLGGLRTLIKNIRARNGSVERAPGSGRPRTVRTPANVQRVRRILLSQNEINAAIDQWRERLQNVVLQQGGHIEQIYRNRH